MKRIAVYLLLFVLLALQACATLVPAPDYTPDPGRGAPVEAYARVLARYVNERGEVDFPALARDRADLDYYAAYVARTPGHQLATRNDRLAHYINSYNALSMYNVLEAGIPETHAGLAKVEFFYLRKLVIGNHRMSLYQYENEVIRPLREPRVHFALNCSARGCPILPRTRFTGRGLEAQLDREARKFFAEGRNLSVVHSSRVVYLSELLSFYPEDFVTAATPSLIAYVNQYLPEPIPLDYEVRFIDYDWTVANSCRGSIQ
ncbi:MAG: DUF547 domain-containing protein [Gammaproteobacteria bacterium]